ncbi:ribonuclease P protein component [Inmirania thermothiophila]|uniref:Ribonuclease P protein component n=1 Tax=Inmirania thermothiophila TaxID=1750597 RepID=A0A3N1Y6E8_9GAMM|nr:ribonuclease P protein component [Inmirania thermothiophila]ROR34355.1 ribonuclease P protein component [Inmirania thermothiophila]
MRGSPPEGDARAAPRRRLPRAARLRSRGEFERVFAAARRRASARSFTVLALPNGTAQARIGLAVSRRAARRAVMRNRIRRIVRESFRLHRHRLGGLDCVVIARPGAAERSNRELFGELEQLWQRLCDRA